MITLTVLFLILAIVFKIVGDNSYYENRNWYGASAVCAFIFTVLLIIWAAEYHGEAIKYFFNNY